jgi:hypothetical protein
LLPSNDKKVINAPERRYNITPNCPRTLIKTNIPTIHPRKPTTFMGRIYSDAYLPVESKPVNFPLF